MSTRRWTSAAKGEGGFEATLDSGDYTFACGPHASSMTNSFTVH